jgi:hypothetical protein
MEVATELIHMAGLLCMGAVQHMADHLLQLMVEDLHMEVALAIMAALLLLAMDFPLKEVCTPATRVPGTALERPSAEGH